MFWPKREELRGDWGDKSVMKSFMVCTPLQILFHRLKIKEIKWGGGCVTYVRG
jgi:hypothetical protein